jgi:hypothetical protein
MAAPLSKGEHQTWQSEERPGDRHVDANLFR